MDPDAMARTTQPLGCGLRTSMSWPTDCAPQTVNEDDPAQTVNEDDLAWSNLVMASHVTALLRHSTPLKSEALNHRCGV